ncbi:transposase [Chitinophaga sancti]|uniref:transposase n=1 Tax=Chitinophaga sancti TaxID=1004 RepID=UPI0039BE4BC4
MHSCLEVINGILWIPRTRASWIDLPERFQSSSTCFRRFSHWSKTGVFRKILETLAQDLESRGGINLSECFEMAPLQVNIRSGVSSQSV